MIRYGLILMALCVSVAGCETAARLTDLMAPPATTMCPAHPALSIEKTEGGYRMSERDMQDLLVYITDLEFALGCDE